MGRTSVYDQADKEVTGSVVEKTEGKESWMWAGKGFPVRCEGDNCERWKGERWRQAQCVEGQTGILCAAPPSAKGWAPEVR